MLWYFLIAQITSTNLSTLPSRDVLFTSTILTLAFQGLYHHHQHHHFFYYTQHSPSTMESIEEQWNPSSSPDIVSDSWTNVTDEKKAVKIWILDCGKSWGRYTQNNKTRLQLHCILPTCPFYIRIAQKKNGLFGVTLYNSTQLSSFDSFTVQTT